MGRSAGSFWTCLHKASFFNANLNMFCFSWMETDAQKWWHILPQKRALWCSKWQSNVNMLFWQLDHWDSGFPCWILEVYIEGSFPAPEHMGTSKTTTVFFEPPTQSEFRDPMKPWACAERLLWYQRQSDKSPWSQQSVFAIDQKSRVE